MAVGQKNIAIIRPIFTPFSNLTLHKNQNKLLLLWWLKIPKFEETERDCGLTSIYNTCKNAAVVQWFKRWRTLRWRELKKVASAHCPALLIINMIFFNTLCWYKKWQWMIVNMWLQAELGVRSCRPFAWRVPAFFRSRVLFQSFFFAYQDSCSRVLAFQI